MLKKTITYEDFDGNTVSEDHYFNLSSAKLIELNARSEGDGWGEHLKKIVERNDRNEVIDAFIDLLRMSYGIRDLETNRFLQSDDIFADFQSSLAYDKFFEELFTVEDAMANFFIEVMPKSVQRAAEKMGVQTATTPKLENTRREVSVESRESVAEKLANDIREGHTKTDESPEQKRARLQKELDELK